MKKALIIVTLFTLSGCATSYDVQVSGFAEPDTAIPLNSQIYVRSDEQVANPVFNNQIKGKIQQLLNANGYRPVFDENVRYHMSFFFGDYDQTLLDYEYDPPPAGYYGSRFRGYSYGGYFTPYSKTRQHYRMMLRLEDTNADQVIWVGEAYAVKSYPYKREAVNYLLLALFNYFGEDTEEDIEVTITENDVEDSVLEEPVL